MATTPNVAQGIRRGRDPPTVRQSHPDRKEVLRMFQGTGLTRSMKTMVSKNRTIQMARIVVATLILAVCGGQPAAPAAGGATAAPASAEAPTAAGAAAPSGDAVTIRYQLWDSNQQPAYKACADE